MLIKKQFLSRYWFITYQSQTSLIYGRIFQKFRTFSPLLRELQQSQMHQLFCIRTANTIPLIFILILFKSQQIIMNAGHILLQPSIKTKYSMQIKEDTNTIATVSLYYPAMEHTMNSMLYCWFRLQKTHIDSEYDWLLLWLPMFVIFDLMDWNI